jgi:hypothetical protein
VRQLRNLVKEYHLSLKGAQTRRLRPHGNSHAIPEIDEEAAEVFATFMGGSVVEEITG